MRRAFCEPFLPVSVYRFLGVILCTGILKNVCDHTTLIKNKMIGYIDLF